MIKKKADKKPRNMFNSMNSLKEVRSGILILACAAGLNKRIKYKNKYITVYELEKRLIKETNLVTLELQRERMEALKILGDKFLVY